VTGAPIVVAGSGPCGSTLALYLARHGVPVTVLEKCPALPRDLRASTFHPPSLEMLDELGVAAAMIRKGLKADRYQYRDRRTGEVAEFRMELIADQTRFPFRLQLEQYEMTHIVNAALKEFPHAKVLFSHEVTGATQDAGGVTVEVATPEGPRTLRTPFLVGADGAGSRVRRAAGIGFGGFTYDEKFLVVSTPFAFERVFGNLAWVNYVADPEEWCVILRTDKLWRVLFPVFPKSPGDEARFLSDDFIQARLRHLHAKDGDYEIGHRTLYNVHQRVSETYCKGRIVLAGDACHINNPLGGMGMNGGIHDAWNLAAKLVEIANQGAAFEPLLARYDRQRRELAVRFVQQHTIENKKLMESTDPAVQQRRQKMLMETAADPARAREFILERAMFKVLRESAQVA
jgi:3-(3-hydroxy-phenyl)propionate hydroxylase